MKRTRPDINCGTCISNLIQGTGREWSFGMHFNNMNSKYHRDNNLQQLQIWKFFIIMISNSCVCFEPEWDVLYLNCVYMKSHFASSIKLTFGPTPDTWCSTNSNTTQSCYNISSSSRGQERGIKIEISIILQLSDWLHLIPNPKNWNGKYGEKKECTLWLRMVGRVVVHARVWAGEWVVLGLKWKKESEIKFLLNFNYIHLHSGSLLWVVHQ